MYQKILAPVDGSLLAECTIDHIKELAKGCGFAQIIFLTAVEYTQNAYTIDVLERLRKIQIDKAKEYLSRLVEEVKKDGLVAEGVVIETYPPEAIIDYANSHDIDLIVMSTHGRSGISRFAIGSVTDKVLRTARMPVMVIPPAGCRNEVLSPSK